MLTLLMLLTVDAHAQQRPRGPSMYGVGGTLSTVIYPARYPGQFPNSLQSSESWNFTKERLDAGLAVHGVAHVSSEVRLGAKLGYRGGAGWSDRYLQLEYDQVGRGNSGVKPYAGLGAGLGNLRFNDADGDELDLSNFIVKAQAGVLYMDRTFCYELALSAAYPIPLEHQLGNETINARGSRYGTFSIEVGVMYGQFKKKKGKGKGKQKR